MRKLLLILLLFCCPTAWGTFTKIQNTSTTCGGTTTCAITVTSTGAGHLLIIQRVNFSSLANGKIISVSGGGTWSLCASSSCAIFGTGVGTVDQAYCLSSSAGTTTVTATTTGSASGGITFMEYSFTGTSVAFDASGTQTVTPGSTTFTGPILTLGGSNDVITQLCEGSVGNTTAISSPYTDPSASATNGAWYGGAINTASGAAPTWTASSGSGNYSITALAIKEVTASSVVQRKGTGVF